MKKLALALLFVIVVGFVSKDIYLVTKLIMYFSFCAAAAGDRGESQWDEWW